MGIYSREWVSGFLIILSTLMIPLLFDRAFADGEGSGKARLVALLGILGYPTLFFYSLDVYRDVFMLFVAMLGFLAAKKVFSSPRFGLKVYFYMLLYFQICVQ